VLKEEKAQVSFCVLFSLEATADGVEQSLKEQLSLKIDLHQN
jgi:hypothetical protein